MHFRSIDRRRWLIVLGALALGVPAGTPAAAQQAEAPQAAASEGPTARPAAAQQRSRRSPRRARAANRPAPALRHTTPIGAPALQSDIADMLSARTRGGEWGVMIVSLTRGDTLYARNAGLSLLPASTMKLYTSAIALERFGPDHQFSTAVLRDGPVTPDGTLQGNLYIRGAGDPGFSNRFIRGTPAAPLELLARYVHDAGIRRITGDIVGDASAFESRTIPEGWRSRYLGYGYAAPFSALSINENVVVILVEPGPDGAIVTTQPASTAMPVTNKVRLVKGTRGNIGVRRVPGGGIEVRGVIGTRSGPRRYELVINEPARFTTGALEHALEAQGVAVDGAARVGETPDSAVRVAALPSAPLARLVSVMNRESVNHFAELIFRNAARGPERDAEGSAEAAYEYLREFMVTKVGAGPDAVFATDGSGLSTLDRTTPRAMIKLLDYAHRAPWAATFHASLPVAGESELLRNRMKFTPAQGNLHAKTGTTNEVISLAGYATAANGEVIAFSFIYNGRDRWNARQTIDAMGATLASFIRE
jgi:D-alanyl-D-alanine carboxypeptidase/D-alanyl-D-alanine-endopeptidase (penicillin-binding protein 4)